MVALRQVEALLTRLEAAEALFPSTSAMGHFFPLYKDTLFVGRLKAMCLWYNITKHQRLKLMILGKILARLQEKRICWPISVGQPRISPTGTADSGRNSAETKCGATAARASCAAKSGGKAVQFNVDEPFSTSDSSTSAESSKEEALEATDFGRWVNEVNLFNVQSLTQAAHDAVPGDRGPYRKYIETVLKSRGLGKSLSFLHRVYNVVLNKAHIALIKPGTEEVDADGMFDEEDLDYVEVPLDKEEEDELKRYGVWSEEYALLNLPSYTPAFVFLSLIPLEVIHECLRMKLESQPVKPNPLSVEQLLKELREGIVLAITYRDRYQKHVTTALIDREQELEKYLKILHEFNNTLKNVLELYLDYVQQMIMAATSEPQQKTVLDREWMFTKLVCPMVPGQHANAANKFW